MKRAGSLLLCLVPVFFHIVPCYGLSASDVRLVTNEDYAKVCLKLISDAKVSVRVMMFEMAYYDRHPDTPSNRLIKALVDAKRRGVRVEVILEIGESGDRATKRNRVSGRILSEGGVEVIYDSPGTTTHAKTLIVDNEWILLGSTNWTYNALTKNNETAILLRSRELAKELNAYFDRVKATGKRL